MELFTDLTRILMKSHVPQVSPSVVDSDFQKLNVFAQNVEEHLPLPFLPGKPYAVAVNVAAKTECEMGAGLNRQV